MIDTGNRWPSDSEHWVCNRKVTGLNPLGEISVDVRLSKVLHLIFPRTSLWIKLSVKEMKRLFIMQENRESKSGDLGAMVNETLPLG